MNATVISRATAEKMLSEKSFPKNTAVISFHEPFENETEFVDYSSVTEAVCYVGASDLSYDDLQYSNINENFYFAEADEVARFVINAVKNGYEIICQCEHGESRSAAVAAAINEFFNRNGINIFSDFRYCPNQLIYNKLYKALCDCRDGNIKNIRNINLIALGLSSDEQAFLRKNRPEWEYVFTDDYRDVLAMSADIILINPDLLDDKANDAFFEYFFRMGYNLFALQKRKIRNIYFDETG